MLHNPSFFHWIDDYWVPILYYLSLCFKVLPTHTLSKYLHTVTLTLSLLTLFVFFKLQHVSSLWFEELFEKFSA